MFAIISGLGHGAVSRLRQSWDKLPGKYQRLFSELQQLMDPSRNMSKYRQLVSAEQSQPPIVSCYTEVIGKFIKIFFFIVDSILSCSKERFNIYTFGQRLPCGRPSKL